MRFPSSLSLPLRLSVALALLGVVATGCEGCRGRPTSQNYGEARFIYTDATGAQVADDNGLYDFGATAMGTSLSLKLTVQNVGLGNLVIQSFARQSGDPAKVGPFVDDPSPIFTVAFPESVTLASGESRDFELTFAPPVQEGVTQAAYLTTLVMTSGQVEPGREQSIVTLKGIAVSGECALPDRLDFGAVARGDTTTRAIDFLNQRTEDTHGFVGDVETAQAAGIFTVLPESPHGEFLLPAMRARSVQLTFRPTETRRYEATIKLRRADGCPVKPVRLVGQGVDAVISWTPASLDFGYAPPGLSREGLITFSSLSLSPVTLSQLRATESTGADVFSVIETDSSDLTKLSIPAATRDANDELVAGQATVRVRFAPLVLAPRQGFLSASTDFPSQAQINVPLRGVGGGPDIEVHPSPTLEFGRIAYFPNANPLVHASRIITVQNVGTRPQVADPQANLKLGQPTGPGSYGAPYWDITPGPGSDRSEICVGVYDTLNQRCSDALPTVGAGAYDPVQGLEAGVAGQLRIPVRVMPHGLGERSFTVTFYSNDPDEPQTVITVHALAVDVPPCDLEVSPIALQFGVVAPPAIRDLGFTLRNRKTAPGEFCLLTGLELLPEAGTPTGFPPVFQLPNDFTSPSQPLNEYELQPGETKQIRVRAWPQGLLPPLPVRVTGAVGFNVADLVDPERQLTLTATIATACLTISPSALDFGTVKAVCSSPDRQFELYNSCATDIVVNGGEISAAGGERPGDAHCPGTTPCPEFIATQSPPANTTLTSGTTTPISFAVKYHPINLGPDTGSFTVHVTQSGQPVDYVVPLTGAGDDRGFNTDTFRQDPRPKADILLVIDDSGSMGDKQDSLATNLGAFLGYATSHNVDFQIGVTNTELTGASSAQAGLLHTSGDGVKILRPTTPNLTSEFADLVRVGLTGSAESCLAPATKALTAPYVNDPAKNAGFVRSDAVLAVVCVTDARDQAPQPPIFYLSQLLNIKGSQRASLFSYNVIGPFLPSAPPNCLYDDTNDGVHAYMVSQTNGVKEEICTPDWSGALERIGKNAFGYRTRFFLTARPDLAAPEGIVVAIDGVTIPPQDPNPDLMTPVWSYDAATNSINFQPLYVPEPGKTLTVTYVAACIP